MNTSVDVTNWYNAADLLSIVSQTADLIETMVGIGRTEGCEPLDIGKMPTSEGNSAFHAVSESMNMT